MIFLLGVIRPWPYIQSQLMYWCLHCSVILYKMLILDVSCRRHITQEFKQMRGWSTCCPPFKTVCFFSSWACSLTQYFDIKPFSCTKASTEPEDLHRLRSGDSVVYGNKLNLLPFSPVEVFLGKMLNHDQLSDWSRLNVKKVNCEIEQKWKLNENGAFVLKCQMWPK